GGMQGRRRGKRCGIIRRSAARSGARCLSFPPRFPSPRTHDPMKVLVVGSGTREHALAWKIRSSPLVKEVYCAPSNVGMAKLADRVPIDPSSIVELADFAEKIRID